ncbi:hypothetical protein [Anabaena sp. CCY 9614]|uniref:hypothetical protein n=2 Tax=unclassified Anabaena TaxID=2619674 RepID=UPI0039C6E9CD
MILGSNEIEMTNKATSNQQKLVVKLEENAMDSLVHGVEHHLYGKRNTDWKYVILHIFHAVELFLKARLAKHDETLIYRKSGNTVGSDEAIDLLVKEAKLLLFQYAELQESGKYKLGGALDALRKARNSIEHKEVALNPDEVKDFLAAAFVFLDSFVSKELGLSLKAELDKLDEAREDELSENGIEIDDLESQSTYRTLSMAYLFYIQHMRTEGIPISDPKEKWIDYHYFTCEMCEEEAIAVPDPTANHPRVAHCFNCIAQYTVHYCLKCGEPYVSFLQEWEKEMNLSSYPDWVNSVDNEADSFCELCSDWIDDQ